MYVLNWLTSFQPSHVPSQQNNDVDSDVESYFDTLDSSDYDADESEDDLRASVWCLLLIITMSCHVPVKVCLL